jgi:hypothetical protein
MAEKTLAYVCDQLCNRVSFAHAKQACDEFAVTIQDPDDHDELRFLTLGMDTTRVEARAW